MYNLIDDHCEYDVYSSIENNHWIGVVYYLCIFQGSYLRCVCVCVGGGIKFRELNSWKLWSCSLFVDHMVLSNLLVKAGSL